MRCSHLPKGQFGAYLREAHQRCRKGEQHGQGTGNSGAHAGAFSDGNGVLGVSVRTRIPFHCEDRQVCFKIHAAHSYLRLMPFLRFDAPLLKAIARANPIVLVNIVVRIFQYRTLILRRCRISPFLFSFQYKYTFLKGNEEIPERPADRTVPAKIAVASDSDRA